MSLQIVQNQQLKPIGDKVAIDTQLSTTSENAISNKAVTEEINRINSDLSWKPLSVTNLGCTIPTTAKEVAVAVWDGINNIEMSKVFAYDTLNFSTQAGIISILEGWYFSPSNCGVSSIKTYTNNYLVLYSINVNGTDVKNSTQMSVYYR